MARIRTIKPTFFTSLSIAPLSLAERLTFIGLWTHVDDDGRCIDDARLIRAAIWPLDDRTMADIERDLCTLRDASLISRYTVNERSYIAVCGWREHQVINRPVASKLPAPPIDSEPSRSAPRVVTEIHGAITEDSHQEGNGKEGKGTAREPRATLTLTKGQARMAVLDLVALWNRDIPKPLVAVSTDPQPASVTRLARALQARPSLTWWQARIAEVRESEFLTARRPGRDGEYFTADLWWLLENADKVESGRYANRATAKLAEVNGHTGPKVPSAAETRAMLDRKRQEAARG